MSVPGVSGSKHTPRDHGFLDGLPAWQLIGFRSYIYSPAFISSNPSQFLDHEWVDIPQLERFLARNASDTDVDAFTTRPSLASAERELITRLSALELMDFRNYGGREILELISESEVEDSDPDSAVEVTEALTRVSSRSSSTIPWSDAMGTEDQKPNDGATDTFSEEESDDPDDLLESDTLWQDEISSFVRTGQFSITQKMKVQRIEYLSQLPSVWPIPRVPTAFVIDLADERYNITDKDGDLLPVDCIIRDADNDGWKSVPGSGDSTARVTFDPGQPPIVCRRARSNCRGAFTCDSLDARLLKGVVRYELDPASPDAILTAQVETRRNEGTTAEQHAVIFMKVVQNAKCNVIDSNGNKCTGGPMMKAKPQGTSRGHQYFIACSGWTPKFQTKHRTHSIPDHVLENLLTRLFAGQALTDGDDKDTKPCSRFFHPHIGLRQHHCPHAHIKNGREAVIVNNAAGHNHPMPVLAKASIGVKESYGEFVKASGTVGATVAKVDNVTSTKVMLKGKTLTEFAPALYSSRIKGDIVRKVKREQFPNGLDATGAFHLYLNGLSKPLPERYIHSYITHDDGSICILTCVPFLLKLLDDPGVTSFDSDTTYKRIEGKMNEWEVTVFTKSVLRAASVVRAYINRASTDFFEQVFDELQRVKLMVTGRPMPLKKFVPGGNLHVMNSDMDAAQILGICRSVMKHNVPDHSGIPNHTPPEKVAPEFIKICWRHAKEPVHDLKALVTPSQYTRLQDFVYIDSKESLASFSAFIQNLGVKKFKSPLSAEVWDSTPSTTNTNEAQHAWTNAQTGIKLTIVEGIESGRQVDNRVAKEIETSMQTGILSNPNNEIFHREARNSQRRSAQTQKARESLEVADASTELKAQLAAEQVKRRNSNALSKQITAQLKALPGKFGGRSGKAKAPALLTASSSSRVKPTAARSALSVSTHSDDLFPQESDISVAAQPVNIQNTATTSQYIPVRTLATHPQNLPAAGTVLAELAQPVITEYVPPEPELDFRSMTDSQLADYLASFIFDTPSGADSGPDYAAPFNFNTFQPFDPAPAFNPLMPATPPPDHSSQTFPFAFMEPPAAPAPHFSSEFSLPLSHADDVQWPMLPPIRPRSPSGTDSADEIPAESTTTSNIAKKGRPRQEVDPANILTSARSRNPSRRKRCSEEESEPAKKRAKTSKDSG
ncbi:hypothetical protein B0H13DRAFT_1933630 [Mycena leptocephala]|nr:hypothetical protein B0H13DRAFT_1933630 [Mycena leptocephala]